MVMLCEENRLLGAPRIHGELLKPGFTITRSTVSKCMPRAVISSAIKKKLGLKVVSEKADGERIDRMIV
jgi:hypothetical protein